MDENYLHDSHKTAYHLFYNNRREKLTREGITYILLKYAGMARTLKQDLIPERISYHSLRHSRAIHLLQAGVNLVYIRDILWHVSIQTTDIFARADSKTKREALEKAYTDLTTNNASERVWEDNKNLKEWLKDLSRCKSLLKLGKYQCRDFGSQIASISLNILQYNLLSYVKRFESYVPIGSLFREITAETVEIFVTGKI